MGPSPPKPVVDLVERFGRDRKVFLSADYKEEQLRPESGPRPYIRHSDFVIQTSPRMPVIHEESIKACPARSYGGAATQGEGSRARPRPRLMAYGLRLTAYGFRFRIPGGQP